MPKVTRERLRELFDYDAESGVLVWRPRGSNPSWTKAYAGRPAGSDNGRGYLTTRIDNHTYPIHRLVWIWAYGDIGDKHIDHINGVRNDNRLSNLRAVTQAENNRNIRLSRRNRSGQAGVYWHTQTQRWRAYIRIDGRYKQLGAFIDKGAAIAARREAQHKQGFHENHGRAA